MNPFEVGNLEPHEPRPKLKEPESLRRLFLILAFEVIALILLGLLIYFD